MVAAGPRPGKIPTTVPKKQPTRHQRRFVGMSATEKPCMRPLKTSMCQNPMRPVGNDTSSAKPKTT